MTNKLTPLLAAALLSVSWTSASPAAANSSDQAAPVYALAAVAAQGRSGGAPGQGSQQSLYDRLGGIFAISAVVDRFSDAIIENPKLNQNPALVEWNQEQAATRLPGLKVMRTIWIAALAGGPFDYTGLPLSRAHRELRLTEEEFNEVGAEIIRALDHFNVPEREKQELVQAYMKSKPQVVSASNAPRDVSAPN